jgi:hypothetical protein
MLDHDWIKIEVFAKFQGRELVVLRLCRGSPPEFDIEVKGCEQSVGRSAGKEPRLRLES